MSRFKKFAAGALAAAICAVSFAAPAPETADAATYCNHTIYRVSSKEDNSFKSTHQTTVSALKQTYSYNPKTGILSVTYSLVDVPATCTITTKTYRNEYACYKCSYTYTGYHNTNTHSHCR